MRHAESRERHRSDLLQWSACMQRLAQQEPLLAGPVRDAIDDFRKSVHDAFAEAARLDLPTLDGHFLTRFLGAIVRNLLTPATPEQPPGTFVCARCGEDATERAGFDRDLDLNWCRACAHILDEAGA